MQKPIVSAWNKPNADYYELPSARLVKAPPGLRFFCVCGVFATVLGWQGYAMASTYPDTYTALDRH